MIPGERFEQTVVSELSQIQITTLVPCNWLLKSNPELFVGTDSWVDP